MQYDVSLTQNATFGAFKSLVYNKTGVLPSQQKYAGCVPFTKAAEEDAIDSMKGIYVCSCSFVVDVESQDCEFPLVYA